MRKPHNWFQIASNKHDSLVAEATDFCVCLQTKASYISAFYMGLLYTSGGVSTTSI